MKKLIPIAAVCDKCGAYAPVIGEKEGWKVFDTSKPCACGGRFGVQMSDEEPKTDAEVDAYLRAEGVDPDVVARNGRVFVETVSECVALRARVKELEAKIARLTTVDDAMVERAYLAFDTGIGSISQRIRAAIEAALEVKP